MPKVCTFGLVESEELQGLCYARSGQLCKLAGGAFTDLGNAFNAHTKVPGILGKFSLKRGGRRFGRALFGFEENFHELGADEIDRGGANGRSFDEIAESEGMLVGLKRDNEAAAGGRCWKRAEVEASDGGKSAEGADEQLVEVVAGDVFDDAAAAFAKAACAVNKLRAYEEVAGGAVRMAKR